MRELYRLSIVVCLSFALAACGGDNASSDDPANNGSTDTPTDGDNADFAITSHLPEADAEQQSLATEVSIEFTRAPMAETVSNDTIFLTQEESKVAAELLHEPGSRTVTLVPETQLEPLEEYQVQVTEDLMDSEGNTFGGTSWSFTTVGNLGTTPQSVIDECMSDNDREMLARVNNARAASRMCGEDAMPAADALAWHCDIESAAQAHSDDMAQYNFFSHTGSDGSSAGNRLNNAGYDWQAWAENIAAGQRTVERVVDELLASPGHCVNIMSNNFTEMGAALAENPDADYQRYWTQNFARPIN